MTRGLRNRLSAAAGACLLGAIIPSAVSRADATRGNEPAQRWITNGSVHAVVVGANAVYVGGTFSLIGRDTGGWSVITPDAERDAGRPIVDGTVIDEVSDGSGGWFLAGAIWDSSSSKYVNLVHVAGGRVSPIPGNGEVDALARAGATVFVGGSFTELAGQKRRGLAALHAQSGRVLQTWDGRLGLIENDV